MIKQAALALGVLSAACGDGGGLSFNGTIRGQAFSVAEAFAGDAHFNRATQPNAPMLGIALTNTGGVCDRLKSSLKPKNTGVVAIYLGTYNSNSDTVSPAQAPGEYTIQYGHAPMPTKVAFVVMTFSGATCEDLPARDAVGLGGKVTVTSMNGKEIEGTFEMDVTAVDAMGSPVAGNPERTSGSFQTGACDAFEGHSGATCG